MGKHVRVSLTALIITFGYAWPGSELLGQVGVEDRFLDSQGVRIRYVDVGRGHPVVLLHAMSESIERWRDRGIIEAWRRTGA